MLRFKSDLPKFWVPSVRSSSQCGVNVVPILVQTPALKANSLFPASSILIPRPVKEPRVFEFGLVAILYVMKTLQCFGRDGHAHQIKNFEPEI